MSVTIYREASFHKAQMIRDEAMKDPQVLAIVVLDKEDGNYQVIVSDAAKYSK